MGKHYIHTNTNGFIIGSTKEGDELTAGTAITYILILIMALKFLSYLKTLFSPYF